MELREYQRELIAQIYEAWKTDKRLLVQLPTGAGKTVIFSEVVSNFASRGETCLVLVHREELLTQAVAKLWKVTGGAGIGVIKNGYKPDYSLPIQVASVQSLKNRLSLLESPDLIIIDEAHHVRAKTYESILEAYGNAYQLGVTATPIRLDGKGFEDSFDRLLCGATTKELIELGYLSPYKFYACPNPMVTKGVGKTGGDYNLTELARANDIEVMVGDFTDQYRQFASGKRCLVFAINVEHSIAIAQAYNKAGIKAAHLDGKSSRDDRAQILKAFERGEIKVLTNCALFDEGLDIPALEAVQIARPTASLSRWLQMCGRVLRPFEGKENAIIIDHTWTFNNLKLPTTPRNWLLTGDELVETNTELYRDADGEVKEREIVFVKATGVFEEIKDNYFDETIELCENKAYFCRILSPEDWEIELSDLFDIARKNNYKSGWVYFKLLELNPPLYVLSYFAEERGYKPSWALYRYQEQLKTIDPWDKKFIRHYSYALATGQYVR